MLPSRTRARTIFEDLCFSVQPGETVALLGAERSR